MSTVTHVIPTGQAFSADGQQVINLVASSVALATPNQDGTMVFSDASVLVQPLYTPSGLQAIQSPSTDANMDREKQAIYKHPLFPLMAMLFEKCEQASASCDVASPQSISEDMQVFLMHQEKENTPLLEENGELDNLIIKAIQVLRIHLLELEKVNELCKDFCQRYTNCLKGKLQSENLLRTESDYDQSMFDEPPTEEGLGTVQTLVSTPTGSGLILQQPTVATMPTLGPGQIMSGGTIYQMVQTPQGLVAQPVQIQQTMSTLSPQLIHGSTPLSQIGVPTSTLSSVSVPSSAGSGPLNMPLNSMAGSFDSDDEDTSKSKKSKRGVLPKSATQVMKSWLFQHIVHPYPTEDEKRQIATQTNLTLLQVNNWFINARRRILQPMLDAGNPEQSKTKKPKPQTKPPQRFWPFGSNQGSSGAATSTMTPPPSTVTSPSLAGAGSSIQTLVIPSGPLFTADGQLVSIPGMNMHDMKGSIKLNISDDDPLSPDMKEPSDTNNNSHNTDNDSNENDGLT
ncbi:homeobox protein PKNOX1-like [Mya arenaria]|uniref:homeobox protein PKNOX1-like n=1 Tax=Mya arenaria TaxID=6604 RepID=UPI0022E8F90C|nr:homeobox protein PKNOX1-like [Mya arenaria]